MHPPVLHEDPDAALERAASLLRSAGRVAVLTGAGISAESGLATFRGAGGLWEGHRVEDVATPQAFRRDPHLVWRFYNQRRAALGSARPNPGHDALAAMQRRWGDGFTLITQNVDGLHRVAGCADLLELHGCLTRVRCTGCDALEDRGIEPLDDLPQCGECGAMLRPDIVWFGEMLPEGIWERAELAAVQCDCFLVVGTSAIVYPAAGLIAVARHGGAKVIEVNLTHTAATDQADVGLYGPSGEILPLLLNKLDEAGYQGH
jgi:NAD-dependent deacetylase